MIAEGRYAAKALDWAVAPSQYGNKLVVLFGIIAGQYNGETIQWTGFFDEDRQDRNGDCARVRTMRAARDCGVHPEVEQKLRPTVLITVKRATSSGKTYANVTWVERMHVRCDNKLPKAEAVAFLQECERPKTRSQVAWEPDAAASGPAFREPAGMDAELPDDDLPF